MFIEISEFLAVGWICAVSLSILEKMNFSALLEISLFFVCVFLQVIPKSSAKDNNVFKCECNTCEESQNNTCITDGFCIAEAILKDGKISYSYGCINKSQILPPGEIPFVCRNQTYGLRCCYHDYCNKDLLLQLPPDTTDDALPPTANGCHDHAMCTWICQIMGRKSGKCYKNTCRCR